MRRLAAFAFLLLFATTALAALNFPPLTGRVVDDAHILSDGAATQLDNMLAAHEQQTTDQIVVATVSSLQGTSIEDYGYQLGRFWGIGQKDKNNGALLIVAPNERKVRIEVGYGLEDRLTDAECTNIIDGVILPKFRTGNMQQGIVDGTNAILAVLGGEAAASATPDQRRALHLTQQQIAHLTNSSPQLFWIGLFVLGLCIISFFMTLADRPKPPASFCFMCDFISNFFLIIFIFLSHGGGSSRSSGGSGGFSGGGGSFGGGGASGGW